MWAALQVLQETVLLIGTTQCLMCLKLCLRVPVLTFLYAWRDGQQGDNEAQAAVDAKEDLVK